MKSIMYGCLSILALALAGFLLITALEVKQMSQEMVTYIAEANDQQQNLREEAEVASSLVGNMITFSIAKFLEEEGLLSPTDSNEITTRAISEISENSETYGKLIKAVNDRLIEESRRGY